MADKVIVIKHTEVKKAKNENEYLEIVDENDKKYTIFDQAVWNLCAEGRAVKLIGETKGRFFNVNTVEAATLEEGEEATKKDKLSDNKSFALSYSKDLVAAGKIDLNNILFYAELFDRYMNGTISIPEEIILRKSDSMIRLEAKAELKGGE